MLSLVLLWGGRWWGADRFLRGGAVAFNLYDLGKTGSINKTEMKNLLVDVLADNPALRLTDEQINKVIEQASSPTYLAIEQSRGARLILVIDHLVMEQAR